MASGFDVKWRPNRTLAARSEEVERTLIIGVQRLSMPSNISVSPSTDELANGTGRDMKLFCQFPLSVFSSRVQLPNLDYLFSIQPSIVVTATTRYVGCPGHIDPIKRPQMPYAGLIQAPGRNHLLARAFAGFDFPGDTPCEVENVVKFETSVAILR
jgi:hypothetical protein